MLHACSSESSGIRPRAWRSQCSPRPSRGLPDWPPTRAHSSRSKTVRSRERTTASFKDIPYAWAELTRKAGQPLIFLFSYAPEHRGKNSRVPPVRLMEPRSHSRSMPSVFETGTSPSDDVENVRGIVETTYSYSRVLLAQFDFDQRHSGFPFDCPRGLSLDVCRIHGSPDIEAHRNDEK